MSEAMIANMVASRAARGRGARDEGEHRHHAELAERRRDRGVDEREGGAGLSPKPPVGLVEEADRRQVEDRTRDG